MPVAPLRALGEHFMKTLANCVKPTVICGMLLGLLTGVGFAQRGGVGAMGAGPRPNVTAGTGRWAGAPATIAPNRSTLNRGVDRTVAPIRDPLIRTKPTTDSGATTATGSATASSATTVNRGVDATAAPIRDPLATEKRPAGTGSTTATGATTASDVTTANRNVDPTVAPIRDPLAGTPSKTAAPPHVPTPQQ